MGHLRSIPIAEWLLRGAVAFAFLYPPLSALIDPYAWIGYFPVAVSNIVTPYELVLLHAFGLFEVGLALCILFGARPWRALLVAGIVLVVIVVSIPAQFPILFRDLSIALTAFALAWTYMRRTP